jgi:hypothetical protein
LNYLANEKVLRDTQFQQLQEDKEESVRKMNEEFQKAEILKMDKIYLSKELENYKNVRIQKFSLLIST